MAASFEEEMLSLLVLEISRRFAEPVEQGRAGRTAHGAAGGNAQTTLAPGIREAEPRRRIEDVADEIAVRKCRG